MLESLDRSITELIIQYSDIDPNEIDVIHDIPSRDTLPTGDTKPILSIYLYKVTENVALRSNKWQKNRDESGIVQPVRPFPRINCSYIITAWMPNAFRDLNSDAVQDEHFLLGRVMSTLISFPNLPKEILQPELSAFSRAHPDFEFPTAALLGDEIQSPGEFWSAIGYKIKPFLNYVVTIGVEPRDIDLVARMVTEIDMRSGIVGKNQNNVGYYLIGGRVLQRLDNGETVPAPYASVTIEGITNTNNRVYRSVNCNEQGYYFFNKISPNLSSQLYRFRATYTDESNNSFVGESEYQVPKPLVGETDRFYTIIVE